MLQALSLIFLHPLHRAVGGCRNNCRTVFRCRQEKALRSAVFNSALVTAIFGIVISLLSVPATRPILELLKVPDKLIGDSVAYMQIACGGTIAVAAYNWINAIMRALGDSKTPLIFLVQQAC